jgi:hypothetical protein
MEGIPSAEILAFLDKAEGLKMEEFNIPEEVWVEIIYSFAAAAHKKTMNREHLLKSLTPLYIGRTASFVIEAWNSDAQEVEEKIERLCRVFEEKKTILMERWD